MNFKKTALALSIFGLGLQSTDEVFAFGGAWRGTTALGDKLAFGNGAYETFYHLDAHGAPVSLGVSFNTETLEDLPGGHDEPPHDGKTCYDLDGNDEIDPHTECVGGHSKTLHFGDNPTPFNSITINWEPHGHVPAGVYDKPHFDFNSIRFVK